MPTGSRPSSRPGAGPGRGRPRARTQTSRTSTGRTASARTTTRTGATSPKATKSAVRNEPPVIEAVAPAPARPAAAAEAPRRSSITTRAIALAVVMLILTISYANSLRIYFAQSHSIAVTQAEIVERKAAITDLEDELASWDDPDYVKQRAREQLGWVVPGERGYTVVGADGKPLGGGSEIDRTGTTVASDEPQPAWWQRLWGSVEAADKPAPAPVKKKKEAPITEQSVPDEPN